jgi:hypothetical protein
VVVIVEVMLRWVGELVSITKRDREKSERAEKERA